MPRPRGGLLAMTGAAIRRAWAANRAYYRGLVVRAIEDALILLLMGAAIWSLCHVAGGILSALGVGA